ncbi:MAG: hypothetical protein ACTSXL_01555 [Alphaproteobacteria bacterium]|nr:MAG: hypothetical protein B6I23_02455 [Rickettsiaceae bacterium 4572_127]
MINENDLISLQKMLIPTEIESSLDKASVANLCRTTADLKMAGICIESKHISFAWNCLERHKIPILIRENFNGNKKKALAKLTEFFDAGVHFCELDISMISDLIEQNFPTKKIIVSIPYHEISSRKKAIEIMNSFSPFYGISLVQDGSSEIEKLTAVFRLFEGIKDVQSIPKWFLFDLPPTKNAPLFAQNIMRLGEKKLIGIDTKISFHLPQKTIKYFTRINGGK